MWARRPEQHLSRRRPPRRRRRRRARLAHRAEPRVGPPLLRPRDLPMTPAESAPDGLLLSRDLIFTSKVTGTAQALGHRVRVVAGVAKAASLLAEFQPRAAFLDLAAGDLVAPRRDRVLQARLAGDGPRRVRLPRRHRRPRPRQVRRLRPRDAEEQVHGRSTRADPHPASLGSPGFLSRQYASAEMISPLARVPRAHQMFVPIVLLTNRTLPSAIRTLDAAGMVAARVGEGGVVGVAAGRVPTVAPAILGRVRRDDRVEHGHAERADLPEQRREGC